MNYLKLHLWLLLCLILCLQGSYLYQGYRESIQTDIYELSGTAMTVPYKIMLPLQKKESQATIVCAQKIIEAVFFDIDSIFNIWNSESEIARFNDHVCSDPFFCSDTLYRFLEWVSTIVAATDGLFDPTIETIHVHWKTAKEHNKIPDLTLLHDAFLSSVSWSSLDFNPESHCISKKNPHVRVDLSGIIKGYAVDLLASQLCAISSTKSVYVDWGGEISVRGTHPEKRAWKVFLENSHNCAYNDLHKYVVTLTSPLSIATSGDSVQRWQIEGKQYTHIYKPGEIAPLEKSSYSLTFVSALHPSCAVADAFATALFTLRDKERAYETARKWKKNIPELQFWICFDDSTIVSVQ